MEIGVVRITVAIGVVAPLEVEREGALDDFLDFNIEFSRSSSSSSSSHLDLIFFLGRSVDAKA
jgi:hypothetical protein